MAYNRNNLSVLAHANGFTLWHYSTADASTDTDTAGYFNSAADMIRVGDMILANINTDSANPGAGIFLVSYVGNRGIAVENLTNVGSTDD